MNGAQNGNNQETILFNLATPLGFNVRTTEAYWDKIATIKHRSMLQRLEDVKLTLCDPVEIRQSIADNSVYLFYSPIGLKRWICCVAKRLNGDGFLVTAYITESIKEGELQWQK